MKTFKNQAAQGDVMFIRVDALPKNVKIETTTTGQFVIAHSETGHNHVIDAAPHVKLYSTNDPFVSYLEVIEATDASEVVIEHLRSFDTHESIKFSPGIYAVRRQREYTPQGFRRAAD